MQCGGARFLLCGPAMPPASQTPPLDRDDLVATADGVVEGLRRLDARIARVGADGERLAALIAEIGARLLDVAAQVDAAGAAGDARADELRQQVAGAAATARTLAADALRALARTAAVLDAQHDALGPGRTPHHRH